MNNSPQASPRRLASLSAEARKWVEQQRFDRFIEKHEGPWSWDYLVSPRPYEMYDSAIGGMQTVQSLGAEFLMIEGRVVLLPVDQENHPHIHIQRVIVGEGGASLIVFLTDTTWGDDPFSIGRVAICDRVPDDDWYLCHLYHQRYATDRAPVR